MAEPEGEVRLPAKPCMNTMLYLKDAPWFGGISSDVVMT